jgi:hypothetical protein
MKIYLKNKMWTLAMLYAAISLLPHAVAFSFNQGRITSGHRFSIICGYNPDDRNHRLFHAATLVGFRLRIFKNFSP